MRGRLRGWWVEAAVVAVVAAAGCDQSVQDDADAEGGGGSVTVVFGDAGHEVVLGDLATTLVDGTPVIGLQAVVQAALPGEDWTGLLFDFEASDGFRPEQREFCSTLVPVDWDTLGRGYINPATRDLVWDTALGFPGCMSPRDVAKIDVTRP
jgi:hypothetical protein